MTRTGRVYTPEHLGGTSKEDVSKPPVAETGYGDLWRKVKAREYSVVDHLNKTPTQISILSLLQNSETRRNAPMKVLSEAYVPANITSGEMANMVGQTFHQADIMWGSEEDEALARIRKLFLDDEDMDCRYHQIWMDGEDAEKTAFMTPWGMYCYKIMPFSLKNVGATYMRGMTTIFHDMTHKEIEVYVDDVIIKSRRSTYHIADLRKFFDRL
nr:uncharacterized protein LOC108948041 [Nicotiana tomentosiformis]